MEVGDGRIQRWPLRRIYRGLCSSLRTPCSPVCRRVEIAVFHRQSDGTTRYRGTVCPSGTYVRVIVRFHFDDDAIALQTNASMRCRSLTTAKHATHMGGLLGEGDTCQRGLSPKVKMPYRPPKITPRIRPEDEPMVPHPRGPTVRLRALRLPLRRSPDTHAPVNEPRLVLLQSGAGGCAVAVAVSLALDECIARFTSTHNEYPPC